MIKPTFLSLTLALAASLSPSLQAQVTSFQWQGGVSSDWSNALNWTNQAAPKSPTERIYISTSNGGFDPLFNSGATLNILDWLEVHGSQVRSSQMTISNGSSVSSSSVIIGKNPEPGIKESVLTVTGSHSTLSAFSYSVMETGRLEVFSGATAQTQSLSSRGQTTIQGVGSSLTVSQSAMIDGTVNVRNGGSLTTLGSDGFNALVIGRYREGGSLHIEGAGSSVAVASSVIVGDSVTGSLNISDGGQLHVSRGVEIGVQSRGGSGLVEISGSGSWLDIQGGGTFGGLYVADGELVIRDGAKVSLKNSSVRVESRGRIEIDHGVLETDGGFSSSGDPTKLNNGTIRLNHSAPAPQGIGGGLHLSGTANAIEVNGPASSAVAVEIQGGLHGDGDIALRGGASFTLRGVNGTNSNTGTVFLDGGKLSLISGNNLNQVATLKGDLINNGEVSFINFGAVYNTYEGVISGSGSFIKDGTGTLTLTNHHTYTGTTAVRAGTLNLLGGLIGPGGLVTVTNTGILGGTGTIDRDVVVDRYGIASTSLVYNGKVTFADARNIGNFSSGTQTAGTQETLVVDNATGGTINATAGTAYLTTLDGATLQAGNFGALVETLTSGNVQSTGGLQVTNLNGGNITLGQLAYLSAQQGNFMGHLTGAGGLAKVGDGVLTIGLENTYLGQTHIWGGVLQVAALGALGDVPIVVINNGRFQVLADIHIGQGSVTGSDGAVYEKQYSVGEELSNVGSFDNGNTTMQIGAGTSTGNALEASWMNNVLSLDGLDGTSFLLVMESSNIPRWLEASDVYIGWFDPQNNEWKMAIDGNHSAPGELAGFWAMDYQTFLTQNGGWNATLMMGAYGTDLATGQVWAVVDHNSDFTVVPEPSTWAAVGIGALLLVARRRGRRAA